MISLTACRESLSETSYDFFKSPARWLVGGVAGPLVATATMAILSPLEFGLGLFAFASLCGGFVGCLIWPFAIIGERRPEYIRSTAGYAILASILGACIGAMRHSSEETIVFPFIAYAAITVALHMLRHTRFAAVMTSRTTWIFARNTIAMLVWSSFIANLETDRVRSVKYSLDLKSLPVSVKDIKCEVEGFMDQRHICQFSIASDDFDALLKERKFRRQPACATASDKYTGTQLGHDFPIVECYSAHSQYRAWVKLATNSTHSRVVTDYND